MYAHSVHQWSDEGPSWYESSAICVLHLLFFFVELVRARLLGIGETIRGHAIDLADLGKGPGKTISEDGKVETKEGVRQVENSLYR